MPQRPIPRIGPAPYRTYMDPTPRIGPAPYPRPDNTSIGPAQGNPDWWNQFVEPQLETFQKQPLMRVKGMFDKYLGDPTDPANMNKAAIVWHGTGAKKFNKFNWNKIGTGEGAQAYGYGHYLAGDPRTAQEYFDQWKKEVGGPQFRGKPFRHGFQSPRLIEVLGRKSSGVPFRTALENLKSNVIDAYDRGINTPESLQAALQDAVTAHRDMLASAIRRRKGEVRDIQNVLSGDVQLKPPVGPTLQAAFQERLVKEANKINDLRDMGVYYRKLAKDFTLKPKEVQGGILKVDLPDEEINKMLLWDAPLKDQPENVITALDKIPSSYKAPGGASRKSILELTKEQERINALNPSWGTPATGAEIYRRTVREFRGEPEGSKILSHEGVPGIKYLSGMTRSGRNWRSPNSKDFNYVSFSDEIPRILDYYDWNKLRQSGFDWYDLGR